MEILHAIVLGVVQGLSEFLPISSSGHLELTRWAFGWDALDAETETAFDVAVHLGTLCGAVAYLHRDVARYVSAGVAVLRRWPRNSDVSVDMRRDGRVAWALLLSAAPAGLAGVHVESYRSDAVWLIAVMLIVFGLALAAADRRIGWRGVSDFGWRSALALGAAQALALQPGVSRSGATLTLGRVLGFERRAAARLAFLMSLPVIAGAGVYAMAGASIPPSFWPAFLWGTAASGVTGWIAVWGTLRLLQTRTLMPFAAYRVLLGTAVLAAVALG